MLDLRYENSNEIREPSLKEHCCCAGDSNRKDSEPLHSLVHGYLGNLLARLARRRRSPSGWKAIWKKAFEGGENPHLKYYDDRQGGYMLCILNGTQWQTHLRT